MAAHDLRRAINLLGSQERPFLFAIDFAVREGWVWEEPLAQQEVLFRVGSYTNAPLTAELPPPPHHLKSATKASLHASKRHSQGGILFSRTSPSPLP